jgi:hypothetical protein
VIAALVLEHVIELVTSRAPRTRRLVAPLMVVIVSGLWLMVMNVAPDTGLYANPILGGGETAQDVILIGGPATARAGELIRDIEGDRCGELRIFATVSRGRLRFPCGQVVATLDSLRPGDYIVVDTSSLTRGRATLDEYERRGEVVAHLRRRGIDLADVIRVS